MVATEQTGTADEERADDTLVRPRSRPGEASVAACCCAKSLRPVRHHLFYPIRNLQLQPDTAPCHSVWMAMESHRMRHQCHAQHRSKPRAQLCQLAEQNINEVTVDRVRCSLLLNDASVEALDQLRQRLGHLAQLQSIDRN